LQLILLKEIDNRKIGNSSFNYTYNLHDFYERYRKIQLV